MPKLDLADARIIGDLLHAEAGLSFGEDPTATLERKLRDRLPALGVRSFSAYTEYLASEQGRKELEEVVELVTVHETYFFRESYQLEAFREHLLPKLKARNESSRRLTFWSAGCANGEEAYTLAILGKGSGLLTGWDLRVLGSDLSKRCIAAARKAVYGNASFRVTPPEIRRAYFYEVEEGYTPVQEIREMCTFGQMNLLHEERTAVVGQADAIFCRNVLIYLSPESRRRVLDVLYERLTPGGYLMLGHSESLLNEQTAFVPIHLREDVVYRKPLPSESGRTKISKE